MNNHWSEWWKRNSSAKRTTCHLTTELACNTSNQIQKSAFDSTKQKQYCCVFLHPNRIFVLQFQTINHSSHLHVTIIKWRATCDAKSFGEPRLLHALINAIAAFWHRWWPIISAIYCCVALFELVFLAPLHGLSLRHRLYL